MKQAMEIALKLCMGQITIIKIGGTSFSGVCEKRHSSVPVSFDASSLTEYQCWEGQVSQGLMKERVLPLTN
jgi:hypothetical protein